MGGADLGGRPRRSHEFTHGHLLIRATGWPPYWPSALATRSSRGSLDQVTTIEPASPSVNPPTTVPATRLACSATIRGASSVAGTASSSPPEVWASQSRIRRAADRSAGQRTRAARQRPFGRGPPGPPPGSAGPPPP